MSQAEYVFQNAENGRERDRLRSIEAICDPATRRRLLSAGLKEGWRCLEVGAGAGSITAWMAEKAGASGSVTAIDLNPCFINNPAPNVLAVAGDIRNIPLEPESFDLIHTRYVLIHIPEFEAVLEKFWKALTPGGSAVIEEPDFSASRALGGSERGIQSFRKVHRAIICMYSSKGSDPALGSKIPGLLQKRGAKNIVIENDSPVSQGGSGVADMMHLSAAQLRDKYIATGEATAEDMADYAQFTRSPDSSAVYYATIGASGQK